MDSDNRKMLEINFGNKREALKLPLIEVENNIFMLSTKENHAVLFDELKKWVLQYSFLTEDTYQKMVILLLINYFYLFI